MFVESLVSSLSILSHKATPHSLTATLPWHSYPCSLIEVIILYILFLSFPPLFLVPRRAYEYFLGGADSCKMKGTRVVRAMFILLRGWIQIFKGCVLIITDSTWSTFLRYVILEATTGGWPSVCIFHSWKQEVVERKNGFIFFQRWWWNGKRKLNKCDSSREIRRLEFHEHVGKTRRFLSAVNF